MVIGQVAWEKVVEAAELIETSRTAGRLPRGNDRDEALAYWRDVVAAADRVEADHRSEE